MFIKRLVVLVCFSFFFLIGCQSQNTHSKNTDNIVFDDETEVYATLKDGQIYLDLPVDLNSDGNPENLKLKAVKIKNLGEEDLFCGQLQIFDTNKTLLWKSATTEKDCMFTVAPWGVTEIALLGDLDSDGNLELIREIGRSDVGWQSFDIYTWTGTELKLKNQNKTLMLLTPRKQQFEWFSFPANFNYDKDYYTYSKYTYISNFVPTRKLSKQAKKISYEIIGDQKLKVSTYNLDANEFKYIYVTPNINGFKINK